MYRKSMKMVDHAPRFVVIIEYIRNCHDILLNGDMPKYLNGMVECVNVEWTEPWWN
jgi:hypothetical protein